MGIKTPTHGLLQDMVNFCLLVGNWTLRFFFIKFLLHLCLVGTSKKLAGLVLRGQDRARFLEDVQRVLEGLVSGSKWSQPHLTAEEYWNQLSGAVWRAGQSFLQR